MSGNCSDLAVSISKIAYNIAERPEVQTFEDVIGVIQEVLPEVTREQVIDSIESVERQARDTQKRAKSKLAQIKEDALLEASLRRRFAEIEQRVLDEDPAEPPEKTAKRRSDVIEELRKATSEMKGRESDLRKIESILEQLDADEFEKTTRTPKELTTPEGKRLAEARKKMQGRKTEKSIEEEIADLQKQIATGKFKDAKKKPTPETTEAIRQARAVRDRLKREIALRKDIAAFTDQLERDSFPEVPNTAKAVDPELEKLEIDRDLLKRQIRMRINSLKPKKPWDHVRGFSRFLQGIITTGEFSAFLIQGGFAVLGHPITGAKVFKNYGLASMESDEAQARIERKAKERPNWYNYHRAKLFIATADDIVTQREESILSQWVEKIPGVSGLARFHRNFLNGLRMELFDMIVEGLGGAGSMTTPEMQSVAFFLNIATGRGHLGRLEGAAIALADFGFAPRHYASRLEMMAGAPLWVKTSDGMRPTRRVQKVMAEQYARYALGLMAVYAAMALAGGDFEEDPRSSDFMKMRWDNVRLSMTSGFGQFITFASRILSGTTKRINGEVRPLRDKWTLGHTGARRFGDPGVGDAVGRFARSKSSPLMGLTADVATGEDFMGRPSTLKNLALHYAGPMTYHDVYDVLRTDLSLPHKISMSAVAVLGAQLQVYEDGK